MVAFDRFRDDPDARATHSESQRAAGLHQRDPLR